MYVLYKAVKNLHNGHHKNYKYLDGQKYISLCYLAGPTRARTDEASGFV